MAAFILQTRTQCGFCSNCHVYQFQFYTLGNCEMTTEWSTDSVATLGTVYFPELPEGLLPKWGAMILFVFKHYHLTISLVPYHPTYVNEHSSVTVQPVVTLSVNLSWSPGLPIRILPYVPRKCSQTSEFFLSHIVALLIPDVLTLLAPVGTC